MVTRRAVLKGTAGASIGAIAAAHGATPIDAASLDVGFGNLEGGGVGGFWKLQNAFQISVKFHKFAADIFFKEDVTGVTVFSKFFQKVWSPLETQLLSDSFSKLETATIYFSKIRSDSAEFFLEGDPNNRLRGEISMEAEKGFLKITENPEGSCDGQIT